MSVMKNRMTRRSFFWKTAGLSSTAITFPFSGTIAAKRAGSVTPIIVTSHVNRTGQEALKDGWAILQAGGSAVDAVEKAANIIELDPEDTSVGYGGLPNEKGVVQLDASFMDGRTYSAGAVACLENIKTPSSVAKLVMQRTDHVLLSGAGALEFARAWGFKEENLLTEKARKIWLRWKEELSPYDDWGGPEHLVNMNEKDAYIRDFPAREQHYGTTNVLAVDIGGNIAGCTTTSGLSFKMNGRVGDSPIIGAGLYVDNDTGAAAATGRGEDVLKSCASFYMVMRMKEGKSPQEACEDALHMIAGKYRNVNPMYYPSEKFVAINKSGETGCASMKGSRDPRMSVMTKAGYSIFEGIVAYPEAK